MNTITIRLSVMMFLQFFIWGGWFVTLGTFLGGTLGASGGEIGMAFSTQSWGAIIAPFIIGLIADRFFNAERILGILHLVGAVLMYLMYQSGDFASFYPYVLGYMIAYMPTLALVNSVSFGQMKDPTKEFGKIRVWGTIGWIVAGLVISYVFSWDSQQAIADGMLRNTFMLCAIASAALGVYSFTLPATPPASKGQEASGLGELLGLDALSLLKDKNFLVFFLSSVLICIPLAFYYQNANPFLTEIGVENATGKMTLGQVSEVLFMLALPVFLNRFGIKLTLMLGMAAWVLRYALFALGDADGGVMLLIVGIALHGICYDFFFVSGQIYTNAKATEQCKSAAQGLITLATYGVGMLVGFWVAGQVTDAYVTDAGHDWAPIWYFPAGFALAVLVIFVLLFKGEKVEAND
ncbi:nucleoside transporter [Marisediminitalea aggregata]|uniref:Nucleoside transporter n=1 Tax=Marisediminitalea aggregata TaxID=634436 RepID=A0A1M5E6G9_9ALTE|nr:nucleoside permease [Marisediminitalea aggregata]MAH55967.1 MFS transporter [Aestuariibacter sp.]MEC7468272.1 nucleoside permease [Pseudomonadota bacterium]MCP4524329.1 nucleoside permease [Aestuariibacter sp.]MCP4946757.1 nucleoside permease [Aestuariibacter sp.]MCP9477562.1 nucleoside permease [Marisediminitalea aggregata]